MSVFGWLAAFALCLLVLDILPAFSNDDQTEEAIVGLEALQVLQDTPVRDADEILRTTSPTPAAASAPISVPAHLRLSEFNANGGNSLTRSEFVDGCQRVCQRVDCGSANCQVSHSFAAVLTVSYAH